MKPVHIFVGGSELIGYTSMSLKRKKEKMTGQLDIELFMGYMPNEAILGQVVRGAEITVYIGGNLAFTGNLDRRSDTGNKSEEEISVGPNLTLGADQYVVQLSARGKTKYLVDSSHQHPTTNILNTTNQAVFEELVKPWGLSLDWLADVIQLDRVRLNDGGLVFDELLRICEECSMYMYEGREGVLRITDSPENRTGEPIVLGTNILNFNTNQAGDQERSEVVVKGHLAGIEDWGANAIRERFKRVADSAVPQFSPLIVQLYGNATDELIDRRVQYEVNRRSSAAKRITVEVFHVQESNGEPWDIGSQHYVEIPPAGVSGNFEIIEVDYVVRNNQTLKTRLTLSPPPVKQASGPASGGLLAGLPEISPSEINSALRVQSFGIEALAAGWAGPALSVVQQAAEGAQDQILSAVESAATPPLTLPNSFSSEGPQ